MAYHPTKNEATVPPAENFDAREDAEKIHGTNRGEDLIDILCHRTKVQRLKIAETYKTLYGKDMIEILKKKTSGNFRDLLVALSTPLPMFYAKELHDAMAGIGTNESTLIEILATLSNHDIKIIRETYKDLYAVSLENDIMNDTSGHFRELLVSLAQGNRDENTQMTVKATEEDAHKLLKAGVGKWGTDESVFNSLLVSRSYDHLEQVFLQYYTLAGHTIEQAIREEFSGYIKDGLLTIVRCVRNKIGYFAERLHKSMKGLGTDDKTLIRIVVTRSEIDLGSIRREFRTLFGGTLEKWIHDDTSGAYRKALLGITDQA